MIDANGGGVTVGAAVGDTVGSAVVGSTVGVTEVAVSMTPSSPSSCGAVIDGGCEVGGEVVLGGGSR